MNESRVRSPEQTLKKSQVFQSPTLMSKSKSKAYLPSRYAQEKKMEKTGFQEILNSIEMRTNVDGSKLKREASPKVNQQTIKLDPLPLDKKAKTSHFKSRPLKREKNDELNFNQIFLQPREEVLEELKKKSGLEENMKMISKQYEKLLSIEQKQDKALMEEHEKNDKNYITQQKLNEAIEMLQSGLSFGLNIQTEEEDFYDTQICIEPPDVPIFPNSEQLGPTQAPSIPSNYKAYKQLNLKELLMRAGGGMNGENVEKEAHLSFFLGEVYSEKRMFQQALKFFKRHLGFAKAMEDLIGMGLGANRVAICYYNCGDIEKSLMFHNENLKLSNNENCFSGFYNMGICYRKLGRYEEALEYLESALSWAQQKGDEDSQCIALGQVATTYQAMNIFQEAVAKFQNSIEICERLGKQDLKLNNLRYILRICSMMQLKPIQEIERLVQQAFECAKNSHDTKMLNVFRCNLGIIRGIQEMNQNLTLHEECNEIEQI